MCREVLAEQGVQLFAEEVSTAMTLTQSTVASRRWGNGSLLRRAEIVDGSVDTPTMWLAWNVFAVFSGRTCRSSCRDPLEACS